ncbi:MAG TPA: D-alanyl-D-alanine carboxypeptidase, partial [Fimbriimonadaceae bacterium]|nr:D-alanyl-D-alanine carboxypeptidase [Fimbriimonadaceae bacterium]
MLAAVCASSVLLQSGLAARIDPLLNVPALNGALPGICIMKLDGTVLYERNGNTRVVPASNQKILSVAYALHTLGPEWRPKTRFWKEAERVVVDCPGDPSMTYEKLKEAAAKLGGPSLPVYVRQGYRPGIPPTWENDDLPHRYAPRITALTVNRGSFTLVGEKGAVRLEPEAFGVRLLQFPGGGSVSTTFDPFGNLMVIRGDAPVERRNLENFAIPEPDRAAASILGGRLFEAIEVPSRTPDLEIEGDTIGKMAKDCLQPSDNYLAECLMMLAAQKSNPIGPSPYPTAPNRMRQFLTGTVGLTSDEVRPYDGSGMSRHNFVTP